MRIALTPGFCPVLIAAAADGKNHTKPDTDGSAAQGAGKNSRSRLASALNSAGSRAVYSPLTRKVLNFTTARTRRASFRREPRGIST